MEQKCMVKNGETKIFFFDNGFYSAYYWAKKYMERNKNCILYVKNTKPFGKKWLEIK